MYLCKLTKYVRNCVVLWKNYTGNKNFTWPPVATVATSFNSERSMIFGEGILFLLSLSLFVICCLTLFVICCCLLFLIVCHLLLFVVCSCLSFVIVCCLSFVVVCCLSFVVFCCLLFVVVCCLSCLLFFVCLCLSCVVVCRLSFVVVCRLPSFVVCRCLSFVFCCCLLFVDGHCLSLFFVNKLRWIEMPSLWRCGILCTYTWKKGSILLFQAEKAILQLCKKCKKLEIINYFTTKW